jgi:hypothetical protein
MSVASIGGFNQRSGMFIDCVGYYDENTNKFISSDSSEVFECCRKNCQKQMKFCKEYCKNHSENKNCMELCDDQKKLCNEVCQLSSPDVGPKNIYRKCATDMECEENSGKFDIKCLENKKYLSLFNKQII